MRDQPTALTEPVATAVTHHRRFAPTPNACPATHPTHPAGKLKHHWYNWYRLGFTTSTIGFSLALTTQTYRSAQRLRGLSDNGLPPVIPGYEKYKGAPFSVLHDVSKPIPAKFR